MYPGYWDDYMDDGTDAAPSKDCIHSIYRVYKDGKCIIEGRNARKQVLHRFHGFTKGQMKRFDNTKKLLELGYKVSVRKWNVSQTKWETDCFVNIQSPNTANNL